MTQAHKTPGALVVFHDKMFKPPYTPFYDAYKDDVFEVQDPNIYPGHMKVKSTSTGSSIVIHDDEVKTAPRERLSRLVRTQLSKVKKEGTIPS